MKLKFLLFYFGCMILVCSAAAQGPAGPVGPSGGPGGTPPGSKPSKPPVDLPYKPKVSKPKPTSFTPRPLKPVEVKKKEIPYILSKAPEPEGMPDPEF